MNVKEFYDSINENYQNILGRLQNEDLIKSFLKMLLNDDTLSNLENAIIKKKYKEMKNYSHAFKGVCLNFDFLKIVEIVIELERVINDKNYKLVRNVFAKLKEEYINITDKIKRCDL